MEAPFRWFVYLAAASSLHAGILVSRSEKGLEFNEAISVFVNAKDKALSLGPQPKLTGPIGKLPSVRITGILIKNKDSNTIATYEDGTATYLVPEANGKNAPSDPAALWKSARISYKKSANDKMPSDVSAEAFVAFLPDGAEELTHLCMDSTALEILGGKGKSFPTQLELIGAVAKALSGNQAIAPLEKFVAESMRQRYEAFESGTAGVDVLQQGLQYADLSAAIYPKQPEQEGLRKQITGRKAWLDRQSAILRALAAAHEWDALLAGDRDFEKYIHAFPDMADLRTEALKQSIALHRLNGEERLKEDEFGSAYREFRLAGLRQPSDKLLQQRVRMAWTDYSRRVAIDHQGNRKNLNAGERAVLNQDISFATNYKEQNKLDSALKSVQDAEGIDPESLQVLLKKAEILGARREFAQALAALDAYDLHAVDDERDKSDALRSDLLFKLTSSVEDTKTQLRAAWADGNFNKMHGLAVRGLEAKNDDPELLYQAGLSALATRHPKEAQADFENYLKFSNTLDAKAEERAKVRALANTSGEAARSDEGDPNWLSGKKLPKAVLYDPVSGAFQPHIDHIEASGKMRVSYEWEADKLRSITPTFEKIEAHPTGEKKVSFAYDPKFPQVASVAYDNDAKTPSGTDPDELYKHSSVVLQNNPYIDPAAIERLTGKNVSLGISGNRYFNPFVWDRIHYFRLTYDSQGRVSQAREIADPNAPSGNFLLEFTWDGLQLTAIEGYELGDAGRRTKVYERSLQYQDDRLVSEQIQSQGRSSKITYKYMDNRLVSANCERDPTLDDRSRQVMFR